jgi:hypothetical protein
MGTFAVMHAEGAALVKNCTFEFSNYTEGLEMEAGTFFYSDDVTIQSTLSDLTSLH